MSTSTKTKPVHKGLNTSLTMPKLSSTPEAQANKPGFRGHSSVEPTPRMVKDMATGANFPYREIDVIAAPETINDETLVSAENWRHTIHRLHVDKCRPWAFNPRHSLSEDGIVKLAEMIKTMGQVDPIIVAMSEDGSGLYDILCGQRRWMAIKESGFEGGHISALIAPQSTTFEQRMDMAVKTQANTEPLHDIDYALTVLRLDAQGRGTAVMTMGMIKSRISNLRKLGSLPEKILHVIKENPSRFTAKMGPELKKYLEATSEALTYDFVLTIVHKEEDDKMQLSEVTRRAKIAANEITRTTRKSWATNELAANGTNVGVFKERGNTCELTIELKGITPEGAQQIKDFVTAMTRDKKLIDSDLAKQFAAQEKKELAELKSRTNLAIDNPQEPSDESTSN